MEQRIGRFIDEVNAAIEESVGSRPMNPYEWKAWKDVCEFLEWAATEAPSWVQVEASIEDVETPDVCSLLGNQTLAHIAKELK